MADCNDIEDIKRELAEVRAELRKANSRLDTVKELLLTTLRMWGNIFGTGKAAAKSAWDATQPVRKD